jgi:DNA repair photolyase
MAEILQVFEKHWNDGNKWMLHIITRSNLLLEHIELLSRLRQMVQVEISISTTDENLNRQFEPFSPEISKRLDVVKMLSDKGVFVRVVAMPFLGSENQCIELRKLSKEIGAKAFKHKGWKKYSLEDFDAYSFNKKFKSREFIWESLVEKSGEFIIENDIPQKVLLQMPDKWQIKDWKKYWQYQFVDKEVKMINYGYSDCNDVDWGYIQ